MNGTLVISPSSPSVDETKQRGSSASDRTDPLDAQMVNSLLRPESSSVFKEEEDDHPWRVHSSSERFDKPLLRIWDEMSGSRPDDNKRMMSRASRQRPDTKQSRKDTLATHLDHGKWERTPYISFTSSAPALREIALYREDKGNRGAQFLTAIDPNIRLDRGLPVLDFSAEAQHYSIEIPKRYRKWNEYLKDHYLCLWEVSGEEVIGTWSWEDIKKHKTWYDTVVMPAFRKAREDPRSEPRTHSWDLSQAFGELSLSQDVSSPASTESWNHATASEDGTTDLQAEYLRDTDGGAEDEIVSNGNHDNQGRPLFCNL